MDPRARQVVTSLVAPALMLGGLAFIVLGDALVGIFFLIAGWYVRLAVRHTRRRNDLVRLIEGVTVGDAMETRPFVVPPQATLDTFAAALDGVGDATVARVVGAGGLLGLVGPREVARVPRGRWTVVPASDAMAPAADLPTLAPGDDLAAAADQLGASKASGLPVVVDGRVAGVLTRLAVGRTVDERARAAADRRARREPAPGGDEGTPG